MRADGGPRRVWLGVRSVSAVSQPFSERFSSILTRFSLFRATGNLIKAPHVPSNGVGEALGMHLGRPRPWAGLGKGIRLKISRAPHHTPIADLQRFRRCGPPRSQKKTAFSGLEHPVTGSPVESENSALLAILGPTVVERVLIVGLVVFDWGCEAFQPFLSRFRGNFHRF